MERLENIASQMERGELALDDLMKLYEEGIRLSGELNQKLEAMNSRMMEIRLGRDGQIEVQTSNVNQQQTMLDVLTDE